MIGMVKVYVPHFSVDPPPDSYPVHGLIFPTEIGGSVNHNGKLNKPLELTLLTENAQARFREYVGKGVRLEEFLKIHSRHLKEGESYRYGPPEKRYTMGDYERCLEEKLGYYVLGDDADLILRELLKQQTPPDKILNYLIEGIDYVRSNASHSAPQNINNHIRHRKKPKINPKKFW